MVDGELVVMYDVNREEKVGELQVGANNSQGPALPEPINYPLLEGQFSCVEGVPSWGKA